MPKITRTNPEGISKPFSNYSHVVTAEGAQKLVFCAGQVGADVDGKVLPPDDFDAQAKMVMANLTKALAAGGAKISDVTKITIYICNPHDVPKARGILHTYFAGQPPASTLLPKLIAARSLPLGASSVTTLRGTFSAMASDT